MMKLTLSKRIIADMNNDKNNNTEKDIQKFLKEVLENQKRRKRF